MFHPTSLFICLFLNSSSRSSTSSSILYTSRIAASSLLFPLATTAPVKTAAELYPTADRKFIRAHAVRIQLSDVLSYILPAPQDFPHGRIFFQYQLPHGTGHLTSRCCSCVIDRLVDLKFYKSTKSDTFAYKSTSMFELIYPVYQSSWLVFPVLPSAAYLNIVHRPDVPMAITSFLARFYCNGRLSETVGHQNVLLISAATVFFVASSSAISVLVFVFRHNQTGKLYKELGKREHYQLYM